MTRFTFQRYINSLFVVLAASILCGSAIAETNGGAVTVDQNIGNGDSALKLRSSEIINPGQDWLSAVRDVLEREEYKPSESDDESGRRSLQAPNRAHGFRTYFEDDGMRVVPREGNRKWEFKIKLDSTDVERGGRRDRKKAARMGRPEVKEDSIEYRHALLSKNGLGAKGAAGDFSLRRSGAVQS